MVDIYPPDMTSPVGRVRKYVPDLELLDDPQNPVAEPEYYFSDVEIAAFLYEYTGADTSEVPRKLIKRAAADVIDALANNEALVLKKIKTEDLETDGPATANALRRGAAALREQADEEDLADNAIFAIFPFKHPHPQTRLPRGY